MFRRYRCVMMVLAVGLFVIAGSHTAWAETDATRSKDEIQTIKVFWLGNSYTASGPLPTLVKQMMDEGKTKYRLDNDHFWIGGMGWDHYVEKTDVMKKIASGGYDYVVLQDFSYAPTHRKEKMRKYGKILAEAVKEAGGKPIFYCTWAKAHLAHEADEIIGMYEEVTLGNDGIMSPVGAAWKLMVETKKKHDITLHRLDKSHPLAEGTYLNACVFYSVFTGESPIGVDLRESKPYGFGKKNLTKYREIDPTINNDKKRLTDRVATILQKAAWATIKQYKQENRVPVMIKAQTTAYSGN